MDEKSDAIPPLDVVEAPEPRLSWADRLAQWGVLELVVRYGSHLVVVVVAFLFAWALRTLDLEALLRQANLQGTTALAAELPTPTPTPDWSSLLPPLPERAPQGVARQALLRTIIPSRPRYEIIEYTVQPGDTVFGIAEKFGLQPETILWGNYDILLDDPHRLRPGQVLRILPVDGTYYEWHEGDNFRAVARFFGVAPEDIVAFPGNHLDPETFDIDNPDLAPGTPLIIPGGRREFVDWGAPNITRDNPAVAKVLGPGFCGEVYEGPVGTNTFIWPTTLHYLSGYTYSPATNHFGIDIAGKLGYPVYAVDNGVVVYAGWNDWGYGYVVVIDHGNGWQSLYAHLSQIYVGCGQAVYQGDMIAAIGSTGNSSGPHLHFELRHEQYGKVNPLNFLP